MLSEPHTDPTLRAALPEYPSRCGEASLKDTVTPTGDAALLWLAHMQDLIRWDHMLEGKMTKEMKVNQQSHLLTSATMFSAED